MSDLTKAYDMAALAEASYVLFHKVPKLLVDDKAVIKALQDKELNGSFSATQAADFVATWQIVAHQQNTGSNFSATLFKNKKTGEYVYAARGTEGLGQDLFLTDIGDIVIDGLAFKQIVDMYNDFARLRTPEKQSYLAANLDRLNMETGLLAAERAVLLGTVAGPVELGLRQRSDVFIDEPSGTVYKLELKPSSEVFNDKRAEGLGALTYGLTPLSVAGHSLGGHLAAAFTRLFPETGALAYSVNGAGYPTGLLPGLSGNAESNISKLFSILGGRDRFDSGSITNFFGSAAPNFVTMDSSFGLKQQGSHVEIYTESASPMPGIVFGHGSSQMTDALAVYDLLIRLDKRYQTGTATSVLGELETIFKAISGTADYTFESLVNTLNKLLVSSSSAPIAKNNREALYSNINSIRKAIDKIPVSAVITVDPLPIYPVSTIIIMAKGIDLNTNDSLAYRYALKELNPFAITPERLQRVSTPRAICSRPAAATTSSMAQIKMMPCLAVAVMICW